MNVTSGCIIPSGDGCFHTIGANSSMVKTRQTKVQRGNNRTMAESKLDCCRGRGQEAVQALASEGLKPLFHQLDIDDLSSIASAAAFFKEKYGGVDVLVNNAGIAFKGKDCSRARSVLF